jgi:hypothetical protein
MIFGKESTDKGLPVLLAVAPGRTALISFAVPIVVSAPALIVPLFQKGSQILFCITTANFGEKTKVSDQKCQEVTQGRTQV